MCQPSANKKAPFLSKEASPPHLSRSRSPSLFCLCAFQRRVQSGDASQPPPPKANELDIAVLMLKQRNNHLVYGIGIECFIA
ncbi:hypothetical protein ACFX1S_039987 [Malus domestica]